MPLFRWKGITAFGQIKTGRSIAMDQTRLRELLIEQGVGLLVCAEGYSFSLRTLDVVQKAEFYRQCSHLVASGLTLTQAIDLLLHTTANVRLALQLEQVSRQLSQGGALETALANAHTVFDQRARGMLCAAVHSGTVADVCMMLSRYERAKQAFSKRVVNALFGPISTVVMGVIIIVALFVFVMPTYRELFTSMQAELPPVTRQLLLITEWFSSTHNQRVALMVFMFCFLMLCWGYYCKKSALRSAYRMIPFFGPLYQLQQLGNFLFCLGQLLSSGISMQQAFAIAANAIQDDLLAQQCIQARKQIVGGAVLSVAMQQMVCLSGIGPQLRAIIGTAVRSGTVAEGVLRAAQQCQDHAAAQLQLFSRLIGPIALLFVGGLIFIACLGLYQPLLELPNLMHSF